MSSFLFLLTALSGCPVPQLVDWTHSAWTKTDNKVYAGATEGCRKHFGKKAPCLKKFIKKDEGTYYAICSGTTTKVRSANGDNTYWFFIGSHEVPIDEGSQFGGQGESGAGCTNTCPPRRTN